MVRSGLCYGVFTGEDCSGTGVSQWKVFISWPATTPESWDPSVVASSTQAQIKPMFWVDSIQLTVVNLVESNRRAHLVTISNVHHVV